MIEPGRLFDLLLGFAWTATLAATAGAAIWRFRARPAGILLGVGFGLLALKGLAMQLAYGLLLNESGYDDSLRLGIHAGSSALSLLLSVVTVAGVATIPMSATEERSLDQHSGASSAKDPSTRT